MSITLTELIALSRRDLRDPSGTTATWSDAELGDMIRWGIQEVSRLRPREVYQELTYTAPGIGSFNYLTGITVNHPYRIDVYSPLDASNKSAYLYDVPFSQDAKAMGGWDYVDGKVMMPPYFILPNNAIVRVFGYKHYTQPVAGGDSTELDTDGINAVRAWVQKEAMFTLIPDRVRYQQWAVAAGSSDTNSIQIAQLYQQANRRWEAISKSIRQIRKSP